MRATKNRAMTWSGTHDEPHTPIAPQLTRDHLDSLNAERIGIDLANGVHGVSGCVEALEPEDNQLAPSDAGKDSCIVPEDH